MTYTEPTYEEYKKATRFGRFKYRFGVLVMFLSLLSFLFVIFYMVSNSEEIARHPLVYGADKYDVFCTCYGENDTVIYVNSTDLWLEGSKNPYSIQLNISQ